VSTVESGSSGQAFGEACQLSYYRKHVEKGVG